MRASLAPATRKAARGGETRARRLFGKSLIVVQVAFSVVLLTAAGIFVRNLSSLENLDLGIQRGGVLMIALDPSHSGYPDDQLARSYQRLLARFESLPGVRSASICWMPPISGGGSDGTALVEGSSVGLYAYKNWVAPRYFETVGMPLLAGRDFTMEDRTGSNLVAVINQTMARRAFGDANPLGRRLTFKPYPGSYEVIGVVGDAKYMWIREATTATAYLDTFQQPRPVSQFVIRAAVPPDKLVPAARREIRNEAPAVLIGKVATLAEHIDSAFVNERLIAMLSSLFGALGSLLAAIGLYGLLAYTVARRTNEIGIRMALGARRVDVLRMVVREALLTVAAGLAIGIPFALAAAQAAGKIFADLPPRNLPIALFGAAAMLAVAAAAAYLPARRAVRVDPMEALRYE